jgi:Flp pilus assembly protein TadG
MIRLPARIRRLGRDQRGMNIVEFAFVLTPLLTVLLVIIDFGYRMYLEVVVEGTLNKAARQATVGGVATNDIDTYVRNQLVQFSKNATITIDKQSYYQFSGVGKPEKILTDTAPLGVYNKGDCFEDSKPNGVYDSNQGTSGLGGSDDIVYYSVKVDFPRLVPLGKFLGFSNTETVQAKTVLRNQPYGAQGTPAKVCT